MEKINIEKLGEVITEYKDDKPWTTHISPMEACKELAEKVNEIVDFINKENKSCTCKIDKEGNLTIDKACYWHGK